MADAATEFDPTAIAALHADLHEAIRQIGELREQNAELIASHNQVGENVAWLVANTQGIFQMLNSPEMMNQMMSTVLGGGNAGRPNPAA